MKFENTEVYNIENAIKAMRNPLESWEKGDSKNVTLYKRNHMEAYIFKMGEKDKALAQRLIKAGSEHRKFMRQILISVDITAPLYWFKEFDTYKVGTVANSTSTMHKLASTPITLDCFEIDDYNDDLAMIDDQHLGVRISQWIDDLEQLRQRYLQTGDKKYWKELIRWLPEGWTQTRAVTLNYESVYNMIHQRKNHKLKEWSEDFMNWAKTLSHADDLLFFN